MSRALFIIVAFLLTNSALARTHWLTLSPGLEYARLEIDQTFMTGFIHAFKIDPKRYKLQLTFADKYPKETPAVKNLMKAESGLVAVNGGFFTPAMKPLGLRLSEGIVYNPLRSVGWWAVFALHQGNPLLYAPGQFVYSKEIDFAIECGPRLLDKRLIPALRGGIANRTAIGITQDRQIILLATQLLPITTTELATIMKAPEKKGGLNCVDALNLDGGSSTQIYAQVGDFELSVPTFAPISDVLLVVPRDKPLEG